MPPKNKFLQEKLVPKTLVAEFVIEYDSIILVFNKSKQNKSITYKYNLDTGLLKKKLLINYDSIVIEKQENINLTDEDKNKINLTNTERNNIFENRNNNNNLQQLFASYLKRQNENGKILSIITNIITTKLEQELDEKDFNYKITQIKINNENIITNNKFNINSENIKTIKPIIKNVLKQIVDTNDFGLEEGLIYLNILASINLGDEDKLLLDKLDYQNKKVDTFLIKPDFSEQGHVKLSIVKQEVKTYYSVHSSGGIKELGEIKQISIDSQVSNEFINQGYNFQTRIGKGCCGFFTSSYAIELLNDLKNYNSLFEIKNTQQLEENQSLITKLHLNTMMKVSELIDEKSIIKQIKENERDIEIKLDDNKKYYISHDCGTSKCINIRELVLYLQEKQNINLSESLQQQIKNQNIQNNVVGAESKRKGRVYGGNDLQIIQQQPTLCPAALQVFKSCSFTDLTSRQQQAEKNFVKRYKEARKKREQERENNIDYYGRK